MGDFIDSLKQKTYLQIFTIYLRYLIGGAFIIAAFGMGKVTGSSNLLHSMDQPIEKLEPIQQFFRVMTDSGLYWKFIGWTQIIAGILLMSQRFAKVGALIFFGIILNIFIITISYKFTGTPAVTGLMLLATTYLLLWDFRSFLALLFDDMLLKRTELEVIDKPYWMWLGIVMIVSILTIALLRINILFQLGIPFMEGFIGFILFFILKLKGRKDQILQLQ